MCSNCQCTQISQSQLAEVLSALSEPVSDFLYDLSSCSLLFLSKIHCVWSVSHSWLYIIPINLSYKILTRAGPGLQQKFTAV